MAFTKSNVNFQFQQPNIPGLVRQAPDISGGLETLFNQYMQMKQAERGDKSDALAAEARANAEKDRVGGLMLSGSPDPRMLASNPALMPGPGQIQAQGPALPGQSAPHSSLIDGVNKYFAERDAKKARAVEEQTLGMDKTRSGIAEDAASTRLKNATASLYEDGKGLPGQDGPEIITKDGQQFIVNRDAKGNKRYSALPGSQIQSEIGTKVGLSQDGMDNLDYIEQVLRSPEGQKLALKAGGDFDRLKSFNDPAAEKLANAILQAGDAEARVKTGASYNENELRDYFKKLVNPVGTMEGNLDRIARKKAFFGGQLKIYGQGRNIPGRESPAPSGGEEIQTRTLKDGSKVRVKSNGKGGWVEVP